MTDKTDTTALVIAEELNEWARDYAPTELAAALATCAAVLLKNQNARIAELEALQAAPPAPAAVPVLYVSPAQLEKHLDLEGAENAEAGRYLPARKTPAGKFTQPLYAHAPAPAAVAVPSDTEAFLAAVSALPTVRTTEFDGEEADGTPRSWRNRPFVSLRALERLVRDRAAAPAQEHATPLAGQGQWTDLGYTSAAHYAEDMQAVGEALMEAVKDNYASLQAAGWRPSDSPAEVVVDLLNLLDEAKAAAPAQAQEDAPALEAPAAPEWERVRRGLSMMMMGFASTPGKPLQAAEAALDAATEPGMPLACLRALAAAPQAPAAPADPMDWPLPCDVTVGHGTIGKGCKLRTLVLRMQVLYNLAQQNAPAAPAAPAVDARAARDAAFEAVRNRLCGLQRYSFVLDDDGVVRRAQDRSGNWIEFDDAHELFDPVAVDAAIDAARAAQGGA